MPIARKEFEHLINEYYALVGEEKKIKPQHISAIYNAIARSNFNKKEVEFAFRKISGLPRVPGSFYGTIETWIEKFRFVEEGAFQKVSDISNSQKAEPRKDKDDLLKIVIAIALKAFEICMASKEFFNSMVGENSYFVKTYYEIMDRKLEIGIEIETLHQHCNEFYKTMDKLKEDRIIEESLTK